MAHYGPCCGQLGAAKGLHATLLEREDCGFALQGYSSTKQYEYSKVTGQGRAGHKGLFQDSSIKIQMRFHRFSAEDEAHGTYEL